MSKNKFLITQTLLQSWNYIYIKDSGYEDFLNTLQRKPIPPNQAMLDGRQFENMVSAYCNGAVLDEKHKWAKVIKEVGEIVKGSAFQVKLSKDVNINGVDFVLYGILDNLKCGEIIDTKFSKTYKMNKYLESPQHPMYFELCPEADKFTYLISNGKDVFKETYLRENTKSIITEIKLFMDFLDKNNLVRTYAELWKSKF